MQWQQIECSWVYLQHSVDSTALLYVGGNDVAHLGCRWAGTIQLFSTLYATAEDFFGVIMLFTQVGGSGWPSFFKSCVLLRIWDCGLACSFALL